MNVSEETIEEANEKTKEKTNKEANEETDTPKSDVTTRPIIAVDMDDVLCHFLPELIDHLEEHHGYQLTMADFNSYTFNEVVGCSYSEMVGMIRRFAESDRFRMMPVVDGAREGLESLKEHFDLHIVTSRPNFMRAQTQEWLDANLPNLFQSIRLGNHWVNDGRKVMSKATMCKDLGAVMLIDDNVDYIDEVAQHVKKGVLFNYKGTYKYNLRELSHSNVVRVETWEEVVQHGLDLLE